MFLSFKQQNGVTKWQTNRLPNKNSFFPRENDNCKSGLGLIDLPGLKSTGAKLNPAHSVSLGVDMARVFFPMSVIEYL